MGTDTIINVKLAVGVSPVHCVLFEDFLLIYNAVAVALLFVVLG